MIIKKNKKRGKNKYKIEKNKKYIFFYVHK